MGILRQIGEGLTDGTEQFVTIFKPNLNTGVAGWGDAALTSGVPKYQPYIGNPLEFTPLVYSGGNGLWTGNTDAILRIEGSSTVGAGGTYFYFCDYVGFYPKIDLEDESPQVMDNTAPLPRYTNGQSLAAFVVVDVVVGATNGNITINWTDERDQARSTTCEIVANSLLGTIATTRSAVQTVQQATPFILNGGIKRVDSVQVNVPINGFVDIVIVKPLATLSCPESQTVSEKSFVMDMGNLPAFESGAYINFVYSKASTAAATANMFNLTLIKAGS